MSLWPFTACVWWLAVQCLGLALDQARIQHDEILIRNATVADADAITDIVVAAFFPAPHYQYIYQFRDQCPEYHWRCTREDLLPALQKPQDGLAVKVIDSPTNEDQRISKPVAVAVWQFDGLEDSFNLLANNCSQHLDANLTRAFDFDQQFSAAKRKYLDDVYEKQVYLRALATHPDYDGRGFGAANCQWGMALAEGVANVTLIATPVGFPLYKSLGFESIANVTIKKLDEEGLFWFEAMRFSA